MILFMPGIMPHPFTDPSYHLPAFYELWSRWGPSEDSAFWKHAAEVSREFFVKTTRPQTGGCPCLHELRPHTAYDLIPAIRRVWL